MKPVPEETVNAILHDLGKELRNLHTGCGPDSDHRIYRRGYFPEHGVSGEVLIEIRAKEHKRVRKCVIVKTKDDVYKEHPSGMKPGHARVGTAPEPVVGDSFRLHYEHDRTKMFVTSEVTEWNPDTGILKTKNSTYQIIWL